MWVVTLGPFRGKRMQGVKLVAMVIAVLLLALLIWQIAGLLTAPEPVLEQRALDAALAAEGLPEAGFLGRLLAHLRLWYREGF
ncbi:MAG: hypothetical protein KGZ92_08610 [Firmicutes bacterium]|nr:hypothetical protein [Dethiobacter sp.]MBS3889330.1 hypothetical protein [Bacillota bacterium]MBS4055013.1 hypothetical protein [Thermaerobacter sp.]